jgi:alcohol dehydrogenase
MDTRIALLHESQAAFDLVEKEVPEPSRGEVLTEILCCTLCGSDLHTYTGRRPMSGATVLGHEIIGRVVRVGSALERDLRIGQRVTWSLCASCGVCFFCTQGLPQKCETLFKYGHEPESKHPLSGGLGSHCLLRAGTTILEIPDALSDEVACPANCATATVMAAMRRAGDCRGRTVVVLGGGMLGLTAAAAARIAGAQHVVLADVDTRRLELGLGFGADEAISVADGFAPLLAAVRRRTEGRGADRVLEMSGARAAVLASLDLCRIGGAVIWVGSVFPADPIPVEAERVVRGLLRIEGIHNYLPQDLETALDFLKTAQTRYDFGQLVEASFSLEAVDDAVRYAMDHRPIRLAIRP